MLLFGLVKEYGLLYLERSGWPSGFNGQRASVRRASIGLPGVNPFQFQRKISRTDVAERFRVLSKTTLDAVSCLPPSDEATCHFKIKCCCRDLVEFFVSELVRGDKCCG